MPFLFDCFRGLLFELPVAPFAELFFEPRFEFFAEAFFEAAFFLPAGFAPDVFFFAIAIALLKSPTVRSGAN